MKTNEVIYQGVAFFGFLSTHKAQVWPFRGVLSHPEVSGGGGEVIMNEAQAQHIRVSSLAVVQATVKKGPHAPHAAVGKHMRHLLSVTQRPEGRRVL